MTLDIRFDFERESRIGLFEAIWGEHKSIDQLKRVSKEVLSKNELVFITRVNEQKASSLIDIYKDAKFYKEAKCLVIGNNQNKFSTKKKVAIVGGGSSDIDVCLEAKVALELYGINCGTFIDVGVAGIHRLLGKLDEIKNFDIVIVCAGMEGALVTVIAGLLSQPIIAVPVSVGYGVSKDGVTALNGMLSTCSPGVSVMNIDNGFGAAMAAIRILKTFS